jgi:hypothetical protein
VFFGQLLGDLSVQDCPYQVQWHQHPTIVLESDDWGASTLFPDLEAFEKGSHLLPLGWQPYENFTMTTLESPEDLEELFRVLERHVGADNLPAVFTANYVMFSPDYSSIEASLYSDFHALQIPATSPRWTRGDFIEKAKEGMHLGVWNPEYHGMLHANPHLWMERLRNEDSPSRYLFDLESYASLSGNFASAEYATGQSLRQQSELIEQGVAAFTEVFGYSPHSSMPPNLVWQPRTEKLLAQQGIKVIQAKNEQMMGRWLDRISPLPTIVLEKLGYRSAIQPSQIQMGDCNANLDVVYLHRNIGFEPVYREDGETERDPVAKAIQDILSAWSQNQPAILNTHRFNYVSLDSSVSATGRRYLDELLTEIERLEPNVTDLTDWEVAQQYLQGYSVRSAGDAVIVRNFTDEPRRVSLELLSAKSLGAMTELPRCDSAISVDSDASQLTVAPHSTCIVELAGSRITTPGKQPGAGN